MSYQRRKIRVGKVVGDKMNKTRIVEVEWRSFHRVYKKSVRRRTRFKVHDEKNMARLGDTVTIVESRPMSKTKRWRLVEIVERRKHADVQLEDIAATGAVDVDATQSPPVEHPTDQEERYDPDAADVGQEEVSDSAEVVGQTDTGEAPVGQEEVSDGAEAVGQTDTGETASEQQDLSDGAEAIGETEHVDAVGEVEVDKSSPAEEDRSGDLGPADPEETQSESLDSPNDAEEDGREEKTSELAVPASESEDDNIQGETPPVAGSAADHSQEEEKPRQ